MFEVFFMNEKIDNTLNIESAGRRFGKVSGIICGNRK